MTDLLRCVARAGWRDDLGGDDDQRRRRSDVVDLLPADVLRQGIQDARGPVRTHAGSACALRIAECLVDCWRLEAGALACCRSDIPDAWLLWPSLLPCVGQTHTTSLLTADVRVAAQEEDPQRDGPAGAGRAEAIQRLQADGGDSGHGYGALEQDRRGRVRHARGLLRASELSGVAGLGDCLSSISTHADWALLCGRLDAI